jgi:hypothetical protein
MKPETKPGVSFNETMKGGFALGETDPKKGEEKGDAAGTKLAIHCDIDIADSYAFIADPQHYAAMHGHVDFPPLGMNIPAPFGRFNLFSPGDNPRHKQMIYELGFEHAGQHYYVAGRKEVRDDPGFDLWSDTTTLLTRLHKGKDASGPVVGAGVLRLGVAELTRLVRSMTAPGTDSIAERTRAIAAFGRFFLGELWERYANLASDS